MTLAKYLSGRREALLRLGRCRYRSFALSPALTVDVVDAVTCAVTGVHRGGVTRMDRGGVTGVDRGGVTDGIAAGS